MKKIVLNLIIIPHLIIGMGNPIADLEEKAEQIAEEMAILRKKNDKATALWCLQWNKQPSSVESMMYGSLVKYVSESACFPLMKRLLEDGIIKADAYCEHGGYTYTLLAEAIPSCSLSPDRRIMAELLIKKGANVNRKGLAWRFADYEKGDKGTYYQTPLSRLIFFYPIVEYDLIELLLKHQANPNTTIGGFTPFMRLMEQYTMEVKKESRSPEVVTKLFALVRTFLEHGALIDYPSSCIVDHKKITLTPFQFAQKHQRTELVELFEQYVKH